MRDIIRAESCADAWLQATAHLRQQDDWRDYNLVLEISHPMILSADEKKVVEEANRFLVCHDKHAISTVINTIFPASLCVRHGADGLLNRYREIFPLLKKHKDTQWGTYFGRMVSRTNQEGNDIKPLDYLIEKLRRQAEANAPKHAAYELSVVEPFLDMPLYDACTDKHYIMGGPCLTHVSFKLKGNRRLLLTAMYRSHYYIERALGNFYGLALLQDFVAHEAGVESAELVCLSTMAVLDHDKIAKGEVTNMLDKCTRLGEGSGRQIEK